MGAEGAGGNLMLRAEESSRNRCDLVRIESVPGFSRCRALISQLSPAFHDGAFSCPAPSDVGERLRELAPSEGPGQHEHGNGPHAQQAILQPCRTRGLNAEPTQKRSHENSGIMSRPNAIKSTNRRPAFRIGSTMVQRCGMASLIS